MEFRDTQHKEQVVHAIMQNVMETYRLVPTVKPTGFLSIAFMALEREQDFDITIWSPISDWYEQVVATQNPLYDGQQLVLSMRERHDLEQYRSVLLRTLSMVNAITENTQSQAEDHTRRPRPVFRRVRTT